MHCPNCGQPADANQQFCRTCGMSLNSVGQLVAAHSATPDPTGKIVRQETERAIVRRMFTWLTWGMIVLGVGVLMLVLNKSLDLGGAFRLATGLVLLAGVALASSGVLRAMLQGINQSDAKEPKVLRQEARTTYLPEERFPISTPSVTEHTTKILESSDKKE